MACGFRPAKSGLSGSPRVRVVASSVEVAELPGTGLSEAAESGARVELARWSALSNDADADVLRVDIVRLEGFADGVVPAAVGVVGAPKSPTARGTSLRLRARGLLRGKNGALELPEVELTEPIAVSSDASEEQARRVTAARALARRAGEAMARQALGVP